MRKETENADLLFGCLIGFMIAIFITMFADASEPSEKDRCDDVGGIYLIIGQEYNPTTDSTVDVYGCVKGSGT
jgi:hypothetical protein